MRLLRSLLVASAAIGLLAASATAGAEPPPVLEPGAIDVEATGRVQATLSGGYAYTPGVFAGASAHHRLSTTVSGSYAPRSWLGLWFDLAARQDYTRLDDGTSDDARVVTPALRVRLRTVGDGDWQLDGALHVWFPGREQPSIVLAATSVDLLGGIAWAPRSGPLAVGLDLGFRLDRSGDTRPDEPDRLSQADRLSLGISDAHAVIVGLGSRWHVGSLDVVAAWSWLPGVGADAVGLADAPMHVRLGVRWHLGGGWALAPMLSVRLLGTYDGDLAAATGVFEPRVGLTVTVARGWVALPARRAPGTANAARADAVELPPPPVVTPAMEPLPHLAPVRRVAGIVVDGQGAPIAGAEVYLSDGDADRRTTTDVGGGFAFDDVGEAPGELTVVADGFEDAVLDAGPLTGADARARVTLSPRATTGALRGTVVGKNGTSVPALLTIKPGDLRVSTDDEGRFGVDLAPGEYDVETVAAGHGRQRRRVRVPTGGVVILNIRLVPDQ